MAPKMDIINTDNTDTNTDDSGAAEVSDTSVSAVAEQVRATVQEAIEAILAEHRETAGEANSRFRFDVDFFPNKPGGKAGRYVPVLVESLELAGGEIRELRTSHPERGSKQKHEEALAMCPRIWPDVRIPEAERIEGAIVDAMATFLGTVKKVVRIEHQVTRAHDLCDAESGLTFADALEQIKTLDDEVTKVANDSEPDAPKAVTADDELEDLFE